MKRRASPVRHVESEKEPRGLTRAAQSPPGSPIRGNDRVEVHDDAAAVIGVGVDLGTGQR